MNKLAERAHIESDDVAAVSVRNSGDSASNAKNTRIDDLTAFAPGQIKVRSYTADEEASN